MQAVQSRDSSLGAYALRNISLSAWASLRVCFSCIGCVGAMRSLLHAFLYRATKSSFSDKVSFSSYAFMAVFLAVH